MKEIGADIRELLDQEARRINCTGFIADDPVQFPRRYTRLQDIETAALLSATIAWGNRVQICRDCDRMLALMDGAPYRYVMERGYEDLPEGNVHRTFFNRNLRHYLQGLNRVYTAHASLADFIRARGIAGAEAPAWKFAEALSAELAAANGGTPDTRCLPGNLAHTALKRINMAMRWLVRDDGIVDLGVWRHVIDPSQLRIPLDVHAGNTARALGLLDRRANDRRAVEELTGTLRQLRPHDPALYDYALFGIGIEARLGHRLDQKD